MSSDIQAQILIHLNLLNGIGPAAINSIVDKLSGNSLKDVYSFSRNDLIHNFALSVHQANIIFEGLKDLSKLEHELNLIQKNQVNVLSILDDDYPQILKNIYLPPTILYLKGDLPDNLSKGIAFVGSRKANEYGQRATRLLVNPLASIGIPIISGGAIGIDTFAHKAALESNGVTIAILGSGLLRPYPYINKKLFEKISEAGCVISPFYLEAEPLPGNFPARNRIIAGLSAACIIVQAALKSGAMITGQFALNQGKDVFAVPGHIDDELSAGCNKLIADGAYIVTNVEDLFTSLNLKIISKNAAPKAADIEVMCSEDEKILHACSLPKSFDELLQLTANSNIGLQERLFNLQLKRLVDQNFVGMWYKL